MTRFLGFPSAARRAALALAAVLGVALAAGRADAGFTTRIEPTSPGTTLVAGGSQEFVVYLDASADTPDTEVFGFTARLELTGAVGGVHFTGGAMPASGYIFQGNSFMFLATLGGQNPGDAYAPGDPALSITLSDFPRDDPYSVVLSGGGSWSLGVVTVTAGSNPEGGAVNLRFTDNYSTVESGTGEVPVTGTGASVQVERSDVNPVPAPGGVALIVTALPFLGWVRRRRAARP